MNSSTAQPSQSPAIRQGQFVSVHDVSSSDTSKAGSLFGKLPIWQLHGYVIRLTMKMIKPTQCTTPENIAAASLISPFTLDLQSINAHLCSESYRLPRWKEGDIQTLELLYRRFLYLIIQHPNKGLAPSQCIDEYWHAHIVHTKKYMEDCDAIVGHYIHHQPADKLNPDTKKLKQAFQTTCDLYEKTFGEPLLVFCDDTRNEIIQ